MSEQEKKENIYNAIKEIKLFLKENQIISKQERSIEKQNTELRNSIRERIRSENKDEVFIHDCFLLLNICTNTSYYYTFNYYRNYISYGSKTKFSDVEKYLKFYTENKKEYRYRCSNTYITCLHIVYNKLRGKKGHTKDDNSYIKKHSFYSSGPIADIKKNFNIPEDSF